MDNNVHLATSLELGRYLYVACGNWDNYKPKDEFAAGNEEDAEPKDMKKPPSNQYMLYNMYN